MRTYVVAASTFWRTHVGVSSKVGSKVGTNQHMSKVGQPAAACLLVLSSSKKGREKNLASWVGQLLCGCLCLCFFFCKKGMKKKPGFLGRPGAAWLPLSVFFFSKKEGKKNLAS